MRSLPTIASPTVAAPQADIGVPEVSNESEHAETRLARDRRREERRQRRRQRHAKIRQDVNSDGSVSMAQSSDTDDSMVARNESDTLETLDAILPPDEAFFRGGGGNS